MGNVKKKTHIRSQDALSKRKFVGVIKIISYMLFNTYRLSNKKYNYEFDLNLNYMNIFKLFHQALCAESGF